MCLEVFSSLFVWVDDSGRGYVSPTRVTNPKLPLGPDQSIEPAGCKVSITKCIARQTFEGFDYSCKGLVQSPTGLKAELAIDSLIDKEWFSAAVRASKNNQPSVGFPDDRPPLNYEFVRLCVPSPASTDESGVQSPVSTDVPSPVSTEESEPKEGE
jgi:hypothetical protein